ncbi:MAG: hypothetical protein GTN76_02835 [Candidatus Aenigmarchaeota archaeon]|nr:hypothetical protein [Candidatus Aenigmarchaeota archaeon]
MKRKIIILSVSIIAVLIGSGCVFTEPFLDYKRTYFCPSFDYLSLNKDITSGVVYLNTSEIENYEFTSDSKTIELIIKDKALMTCETGSLPGEKLNYWYCRDVKFSQRLFDQNGKIISTVERSITIVFDENMKYLENSC